MSPGPDPTPISPQPSQIEKHLLIHSHWTMGIVQVIFLLSSWPRCQLDFVPINCLQSNANGHKLLLRQPRHFASLTYSSLSIFFQMQTHRSYIKVFFQIKMVSYHTRNGNCCNWDMALKWQGKKVKEQKNYKIEQVISQSIKGEFL